MYPEQHKYCRRCNKENLFSEMVCHICFIAADKCTCEVWSRRNFCLPCRDKMLCNSCNCYAMTKETLVTKENSRKLKGIKVECTLCDNERFVSFEGFFDVTACQGSNSD